MIPRAEIEFTLKVAEAGARCEAPAKVMEELCRVYLAWLDAPEVLVTYAGGPRKGAEPDGSEDDPGAIEAFGCVDPKGLEQGQRVKLVEVSDVG